MGPTLTLGSHLAWLATRAGRVAQGVSFECRACNAKYTLSKEDIFYNVKNNFGKSTNGLPKVEAGMSHTGCCSVQ